MEPNEWKRNVYLRHYVRDEETLRAFELGTEQVKEARDIARRNDNNLDFILHITIDGKTIDPALQERVESIVETVPSDSVEYHTDNGGAGKALREALFHEVRDGTPTINACCDLDQYKFFTEDGQWSMVELFLNMEMGENIFGVGVRDTPVVLGRHRLTDELRKIDEHYKALAIGPENIKVGHQSRSRMDPAYRAFGDPVSGFYAVNTTHPAYDLLKKSVQEDARRVGLNGCATDAVVVLRSSCLGEIARGYIPALPNEMYGEKSELEEFRAVVRTLYEESKIVGQTGEGEDFLDALQAPQNVSKLEKYYSRGVIGLARTIDEAGVTQTSLPSSYVERLPSRYADALIPLIR